MRSPKEKHKNEVFNHITLILLQFSFLSLAHIFLFKINDAEIIDYGVGHTAILSICLMILVVYTYISMLFNKKEVTMYEEAANIIYNKTKTILLLSILNFAILSISYAMFESIIILILLSINVLIQILSIPSKRKIKFYLSKQEDTIKDYTDEHYRKQ